MRSFSTFLMIKLKTNCTVYIAIFVFMKLIRWVPLVLIIPVLAFVPKDSSSQVNWLSFEDAVNSSQQEQRKIFIDVYTDWCGWCKKMDATTFSDPEVVEILQNKFYHVKFNAEQRDPDVQ